MSTRWVKFFFWLYLLILVWADGTFTNPADPDLWHRLALGEVLCQTGHFPPGDYFSYLADYKAVADHEWGSAIIFYGLYKWAGLDVFVAVKLVTLAVTLMLLAWAGLYHRRPTLFSSAFYAVILLCLLPSFLSTVRCMTFSHVLFALWLYWFQCERHGRAIPLLFYLVTMIVWANLHGGFVLGLFWLAVVGGVELVFQGDWKKWFIRLAACTVATLINPFGLELWISTARALTITRHGFGEWAPVVWWAEPMAYPGYKLLLIGFIIALAVRIYRQGWAQIDKPIVVLICAFMALSFTSARHTSFFASVVGALAPGLFVQEPVYESGLHPLQVLGRMAIGATLLIIPLYSAFVVLPGEGLTLGYPHISCPVDAVSYLQREKVRGNLLVPFNYGSYALWFLRDQMRVSMDGRYDLVYRPETYQRVDDFYSARGDWQSLLASPAPDAVLVPKAAPIYAKLQGQSGWDEVYQDDTDAVFLPLHVAAATR